MPVVNENDTTATDEITFGDNDFLAAQVALLLDARLLVLLTNIDGLLTARPAHRPGRGADRRGQRLRRARGTGDRRPHLGLRLRRDAQQGRGGGDGQRGGDPGGDLQRHRARDAARGGGRRARSAPASPRRRGRTSSFKLWLKYAKPARGRLIVDAGAARVLRESGSSLLPVGIAAVEGSFEAGDAVEVASDGETIGKGITDYSSRELQRVIGMKSAQVRELLPHAADEVDPPRPLRPALSRPQLPFADGRDRRPPSPRAAPPRSAPRGRWRAPRPRRRTPRWRRPRGCSKSARRRSSRRTPAISPTSAPPA